MPFRHSPTKLSHEGSGPLSSPCPSYRPPFHCPEYVDPSGFVRTPWPLGVGNSKWGSLRNVPSYRMQTPFAVVVSNEPLMRDFESCELCTAWNIPRPSANSRLT